MDYAFKCRLLEFRVIKAFQKFLECNCLVTRKNACHQKQKVAHIKLNVSHCTRNEIRKA